MKQVLPVLLDEYCTKLITFAVAGISVLNLAVPGPRVSVIFDAGLPDLASCTVYYLYLILLPYLLR